MELEALGEAVDRFSELGATLVLIAPQQIEYNQKIGDEKKLTVDILSDPGNETAARYGIRFELPEDLKALYQKFGIDLEKYNGDASWTLPMPARILIDRDGVVRHTAIDADYTVRPDPEETLAELKRI